VIDVEPERFEEMVGAALDGLPDQLGQLMRNVAVTVEDYGGPPGLLGLYQGIPLTSRTEDEVVDQVRRTVVHEVAHHFGISDERLRELGW
jgi:predicted Zn-dependent protease with MMP-like domain